MTTQEKLDKIKQLADAMYEAAQNMSTDASRLKKSMRDYRQFVIYEVKESEDEKIRKELLEHCRNQAKPYIQTGNKCPQIQSWIAWLESKGEQKSIWHNEDEEPKRGSLILLIMQSGTPIVAKIIEPNHTFNRGERWAYIDGLLEKQGEQEEPQVYETEDGEVITYSESEGYKVIEPKFHEGDWVVDSQGLTHQIKRVVENVTTHIFGYDIVGGGYFNDDNEGIHIWTIQDAKDGDVLYNKDDFAGNSVFIYKGISDKTHACLYYTRLYKDKDFSIYNDVMLENGIGVYGGEFYPATQEQHDLLFQKMHEAGYEWDAEKKQPKKIHVIDEGKAEMDYCFTKMLNGEKISSAWNEDDELYLKDAIHAAYSPDCGGDELINWLKSLKDKIQCNKINWKPSDAQIKALNYVVNLMASSESIKENDYYYNVFKDLREQLKKLKG